MIADYLVAAWVVVGIFSTGIVICRFLFPLRGLELIAFGAAAGVVVHALLGLVIGAIHGSRVPVVAVMIAGHLVALFILLRHRSQITQELSRPVRIALLLWLAFIAACIAIIHVPIRFLPNPPTGPYIIKEPWVNVKIQQLTQLPTDNYIGYTVTEYLLRGLSFKAEHPVLPGEEVTNRTILMSLVAVPFRAAIRPPPKIETLGTFRYVNQLWPDVRKLFRNDYYRQYLAVGIVLNSLLLVGVILLIAPMASTTVLVSSILCALTSTYVIGQTIYIWPKSFAGFFILLALHSILRRWRPAAAATCLGLAFHSHPYAVVFIVGMTVYYLIEILRVRRASRLIEFGCTVVAILLPWFIWKHLMVRLPSELLAENMWARGTHQLPTLLPFMWARLHNSFRLFTPFFLVTYPFDLGSVVHEYWACLPGAAGVFLIAGAVIAAVRFLGSSLWWCGVVVPAMLLIGCFSNPAIISVEGYQPIVALLVFFGVLWLRQSCSTVVFTLICGLQLLLNVVMMVGQGIVTGVNL